MHTNARRITFGNFFNETKATFTRCSRPAREPDYQSASGSRYWYEHDAVVRESDHWGGGIASCDWYIEHERFDHETAEFVASRMQEGKPDCMHYWGGDTAGMYEAMLAPWSRRTPLVGRCALRDFTSLKLPVAGDMVYVTLRDGRIECGKVIAQWLDCAGRHAAGFFLSSYRVRIDMADVTRIEPAWLAERLAS